MQSIIAKIKRYRIINLIFAIALIIGAIGFGSQTVEAKGSLASGDCVKNVLVYVKDSEGEEVLVAQLSVNDMLSYLNDNLTTYGKVHNYSILDRLVTTVHQEAQGFTVPQMVSYAESNSSLTNLELTFDGEDSIAVWEIDGAAFDEADTYTYNELYGVSRYNFPALYEQWDYTTQNYLDAAAIWASRESEVPLLSITAYSERYLLSDAYANGSYNMENSFDNLGLLDTAKTVRLMLPMTQDEFENKTSTANNSRYGVCYLLLDMDSDPYIDAGTVAEPTCTVIDGDASEDDDYEAGYYYFTLDCETEGASIYYNDSSASSYMPTALYTAGEEIKVAKMLGVATLKVRAVKDGCTDAGVQTVTSVVEEEYEEYVDPNADVWDGVSSTPVTEINGIYTINTCAELKWIADQVNNVDGSGGNSFSGKTVILGNNLHLNNYDWSEIGENKGILNKYGDAYIDETYTFNGTFDGNGYKISGLRPYTICSELTYGTFGRCGLFGFVSGATIKNLTISGVVASHVGHGVGGIAGEAVNSTFENCVSYARVSGNPERITEGGPRGGIVGVVKNCTIINCSNYGDVSGNGIIGGDYINVPCDSSISYCTNYADVSGNGIASGEGNIVSYSINYGDVGSNGIASGEESIVSYCTNYGEVGGNGIVGVGSASYCTNFGNVGANGIFGTGSADHCINNGNVGGSGIGNAGSVTSCVNAGNAVNGLASTYITPSSYPYVFVNIDIANSYNIGDVSNASIYGGNAYADISNCYDVSGAAVIAGYTSSSMTISNAFYLTPAVEVLSDESLNILGIKPKTATQIQAASFVSTLNTNAGETLFAVDTAGINGGYPKFAWESGIIFNSNGGSSVATQHVITGNTALEPDDPVWDEYTFIGWYTDQALTMLYDFSAPVNADITLYAGWQQKQVAQPVAKQVTLSWSDDPTTTQTVTWCDSAATGYIQYVSAANYTDGSSFLVANQITATASLVGYTSPLQYYQAKITGLDPDTRYYYRVGSSDNWSDIYTFTTAASDTDEFSFMYMGDIQYTSDAATEYQDWGTLLESAYTANPDIDFGMLGGDMVNSGINMNDWTYFLSYASNVFADIPMMTTNGNHESNFIGGKAEYYLDILALPENGPESFKEEFYSFDYGPAHFLVLNSWALSGEQALDETKLAEISNWITADLEAAQYSEFKIVMMHHPAYALAPDTVANQVLTEWEPLFESGGVDLVLCGHQHVYARSYPLTDGQTDYVNGITYVMGNSGHKFYSTADQTNQDKVIFSTSTYQIINVDGNTLTLNCYDGDGNLLDSWSMTAIDSDLDGDVNGDGVVDMDDVDAVLNAYLTDNDSNSAMDVNGDGVIDVSDAQVVLNIYLGKAS